jgi:hypothetical protein
MIENDSPLLQYSLMQLTLSRRLVCCFEELMNSIPDQRNGMNVDSLFKSEI